MTDQEKSSVAASGKVPGRYIIGGSSPHQKNLPDSFLKTGTVIGINKWPLNKPCDIWIALDTGLLFGDNPSEYWGDFKDKLASFDIPKYVRAPKSNEVGPPGDAGIQTFVHDQSESVSRGFDGKLPCNSNSAVAAMALAVKLGATEIFLYGVDLVGTGRDDGTSGVDWADGGHIFITNVMIKRCEEYAKVYKLNPGSPLEAEYYQEIETYGQPSGSGKEQVSKNLEGPGLSGNLSGRESGSSVPAGPRS